MAGGVALAVATGGASLPLMVVGGVIAADQITSGVLGTESYISQAGTALCGGNEDCGSTLETGVVLLASGATAVAPRTLRPPSPGRAGTGGAAADGAVVAAEVGPVRQNNTGWWSRARTHSDAPMTRATTEPLAVEPVPVRQNNTGWWSRARTHSDAPATRAPTEPADYDYGYCSRADTEPGW